MATSDSTPPAEYLSRDFGWIEFNRRLLETAKDRRHPLLERLRFLAIVSSNFDEFFMKRIGGLKRHQASVASATNRLGLSAEDLLSSLREKVEPLFFEQARYFSDELLPELFLSGIELVSWEDLDESEREFAASYFHRRIFPVLTPLAVDPGHPFPFLSNLSTSLGVALSYPESNDWLFARVKVPSLLPSLIRLETGRSGSMRFLPLSQLIEKNLDKLFPDMTVLGVVHFRVTRSADVEHDDEDAEDLLEMVEEEVRRRKFARIIRLDHLGGADPTVLEFLKSELELSNEDIFEMPKLLHFGTLQPIFELKIPGLIYEPWSGGVPAAIQGEDVNLFSVIRSRDLLVHLPFDSFSQTVEKFIRQAVEDPKVVALKMTLYRTGDDSPFVPLLVRAAESGKQVVCLVELKANFDEERNLHWAQILEQAGVHVVYGVVGLKTHAKTALVVRQEDDIARVYAHLGTGNYHSQTSRAYTDLGLFTCRTDLTEELVGLFHYLTGRSRKRDYQRLLVSPINLRETFLLLIAREAENATCGRPSQIVAKMNNLDDPGIIQALYDASRAGVKIDLLVRGFCCLNPQVPGLSENIRVTSIIGRFLEHSRVFFFLNGKDDPLEGDFYLGSADWMTRNLNVRVEVVTPVEDRACRERLWELLKLCLADNTLSWEQNCGGGYVRKIAQPEEREIESHQSLMNLARLRARPVETESDSKKEK